MAFTSKVTYARVFTDAYKVERLLHADPDLAAAYRRTIKWLKPFPSAIIFPEALLTLPRVPGKRHRSVYAVDFTIVEGDKGKPKSLLASRMKRLDYRWLIRLEKDRRGVVIGRHRMSDPQAAVEHDLLDTPMTIRCSNMNDKEERRDQSIGLFLPRSLIDPQQFGAYTLDALFADFDDACRYQATVNQHVFNWGKVPQDVADFIPD